MHRSLLTVAPAAQARWATACLLWGLLVSAALADPPPPATGADVDESLVKQTLYVDPANAEAADDEKHGISADAPFATLAYACQAAEHLKEANTGVKLLLAAGTYRETAEIHPPAPGKQDADAPLVIEAAEHDQAVIDGADTEGWTPSTWKEEGAGRWAHPWPFPVPAGFQSGIVFKPPPPAFAAAYQHGNLLFVDGVALRQVNGVAELQPGTFWVGPSAATASPRRASGHPPAGNVAGRTVLVQPPEDATLSGSIIQVGVRSNGLVISGRRNVVVRGLVVQHAAPPASPYSGNAGSGGLRLVDCSNLLVEDVLSQWNDGEGLSILGRAPGSRDLTLRRVRVLHNGGSGLYVDGAQNLLVEDGEVSFNNFRGEWTNWVDSQRLAGLKIDQVKGSTWRRERVVGNVCRGMWFEGDSQLTVEEAVVRDNFISGLLLDACPGPTLLRRSLVVGTRVHPSVRLTSDDAAVSVYNSPDVTLESNLIAANAVPALGLSDVTPGVPGAVPARGRAAASGPGLRPERHTYRHNVIYGRDAIQILGTWPAADRLGAADFAAFYATLTLDDNCFWNPASTDVFLAYDLHGPRHPAMNFEGWLAFLASRASGGSKAPAFTSLWEDPLFLDAGEGDFRLKENSPVKDWDLPVDENSAGQ